MKLRIPMLLYFAAATAGAGQRLDVFVNNEQAVPFQTVQVAKVLSSRILASADVTVAWHGAIRPRWKGPNKVIVLDLERNAPPDCCRGALAYSLLSERVHVSIFYDRIREVDRQSAEVFILAHVMAHEVVHAILGTPHHAATGVMKAQWDWRDITEMRHHLLAFTPEDIRMIRGVKEFYVPGRNQDAEHSGTTASLYVRQK